jgi:transcriptional regulator NrdR family protein
MNAHENNCRLCPECGKRGKRIETRSDRDGVRRRLQCPECRARWTTIELDFERARTVGKIERVFARLIHELQQEGRL